MKKQKSKKNKSKKKYIIYDVTARKYLQKELVGELVKTVNYSWGSNPKVFKGKLHTKVALRCALLNEDTEIKNHIFIIVKAYQYGTL